MPAPPPTKLISWYCTLTSACDSDYLILWGKLGSDEDLLSRDTRGGNRSADDILVPVYS
jgi:hypothetical protein